MRTNRKERSMTTLLPRISFAAATVLLASLTGTSASAQSACYQTCRIQYNWPAGQCASYCRARTIERGTGQTGAMFAPAPSTRVTRAYAYRSAPARVYGYRSSPARVYGYTSSTGMGGHWGWLGCR
jgi:hypothetical protein